MRIWQVFWLCISVCGLVLLLGSYAGAFHPIGDSLAVFRLPLATGGIFAGLVALALRRRWIGALMLAFSLVAGGQIWAAFIPQSANDLRTYRLYQKNLFLIGKNPAPLIGDVRAATPDFATFQELSFGNRKALAGLNDVLPAQTVCADGFSRSTAVFSRFPMVQGATRCADGVAAMQVRTPDGPVWVASVHLDWPYPYNQPNALKRVSAVLAGLSGPVIMGGDFNMVPWANSPRHLSRVVGGRRAEPAHGTFDLMDVLPIAIDHVYAPGGGVAELRPKLGSDHRGLLAHVSL